MKLKFSIIVPIYNVEKYLENCLRSIQNQSYTNFEVLMINDGTKDNSVSIMKKFEKDHRFQSFHKENGGLSDARNYGVERATGDYLLFVDSDDEIEKDLLLKLNEEIEKNSVDLIKYQIKVIDKEERIEKAPIFSNESPNTAFPKLIQNNLFVTAWSYAYGISFFKENSFMYTKGRYHEDFGLTPIILLKAKSVSSIDYVGYRYFIRENSIMTDPNKTIKKAEDTLYFFEQLILQSETLSIPKELKQTFQSYVANVLLNKLKELDSETRKQFIPKVKAKKIEDYMLSNTFSRKIKKMILKCSYTFYIQYLMKE